MTRPQPVNRENQNRRRSGAMPENQSGGCGCGMSNRSEVQNRGGNCAVPERGERNCDCVMPGSKGKSEEMFSHLQYLEPAMAYVPCQKFTEMFALPYALSVGTVFPELCKPFCGKRGVQR